jgi:uncharacterized delta-60 repeat protein
LTLLLFIAQQAATAQTYRPDPSFQAPLLKSFAATVHAAVRQPDGKVVIGGDFHYVNKEAVIAVARLNADGTLDHAFAKSFVWGDVVSLALQADGKILVGGFVMTNPSLPDQPLTRLNADGTVDNSFRAAINPGSRLFAMDIQPDGKILIQGSRPGTREVITRLNPDGSLDETFSFSGVGTTNSEANLYSLRLQPDGKILIGGYFFLPGSTRYTYLARLHPDGSPDATFTADLGTSARVRSILLQPGGKILIGGSFTQVNGVSRNGIARLNANGTLDASFDPGTGLDKTGSGSSEEINTIAVQDDGKLLVGGTFSSYNGTAGNWLVRLEANGAIDPAFRGNPGKGTAGYVSTIVPARDG